MEEVTEDESGLFKYLSESVDHLMMVEWRECRPAHVLKTCTVQPLSVIVDEIYLPLLTHEVRALVCQKSYPRVSENMLFVFFPCLIVVVRGSETHETKVWFWGSRQLSDPRNVCRRLDIVPVVLGQMRKRLVSLAVDAPLFPESIILGCGVSRIYDGFLGGKPSHHELVSFGLG